MITLKKTIAIITVLAIALCVAGCSSSSSSSLNSSQPKKAPEQKFDSDIATVTYRETTEPTPGNVMFNFSLENKTDNTVMVNGEDVVINNEYSVQTLGGSATPIAPGTKGSVSLTFGYTVQTPLQSLDELHEVSCKLMVRDSDSLDVIGEVPIKVAL